MTTAPSASTLATEPLTPTIGSVVRDATFMPTPPLGSCCTRSPVPVAGGDTAWADQERAYDTLSEPIKRLTDGLHAEHDGNAEFGRFLGNEHNRSTLQYAVRDYDDVNRVLHRVTIRGDRPF